MALIKAAPSGFFGGRSQFNRSRCVITFRELVVTEPMSSALVFPPVEGIDLVYATDLYQRIYCTTVNNRGLEWSLQIDGAIYSAPLTGGVPPGPQATWTLVPNTQLGVGDGHTVRYVAQNETWFAGLSYIDLWTSVYQHQGFFTEPFTVVHELWGNAFRWTRTVNAGLTDKPDFWRPRVLDTNIRILGKHRG